MKTTDIFSQRHIESAQNREALHKIYSELPPQSVDLVAICAELLRRGLSIAKVARLSQLPSQTIHELAAALGIDIRPTRRSPAHLDGCLAEPFTHLQLSVFIVSLHIQAQMGATETLDAEAYCAALRRTERCGRPVDHTMLAYLQAGVEAWQRGDAHLRECLACTGAYLRMDKGSTMEMAHSARCPFCAGVQRHCGATAIVSYTAPVDASINRQVPSHVLADPLPEGED